MKFKNLTIGQIIEIAKKYAMGCSDCPLLRVDNLPCYNFCELDDEEQLKIEESLEQEIDYE